MLAQLQLTRRNLDRALEHQELALALNPNDDRILCAQGEILTIVMLGDADAAADRVAELYREFPEFDLDEFIESLPHTEPAYRTVVADPLREAVAAEPGS